LKIPFEIQTRLKTTKSVSDEKPNQSNPKEEQKIQIRKKPKVQFQKKNLSNPNLEKKPKRSRSRKTVQVSPCPNP
jgi:hypothetical protein